MRDAFGGIVNIAIIVIFLVVVSGYLAFNISYTKAFNVKNKIITLLEQYEGNCGQNSTCAALIQDYINKVGYAEGQNPYSAIENKQNLICNDLGYCYRENCKSSKVTADNGAIIDMYKCTYHVYTQMQINIPIINGILDGNTLFTVQGETKAINKRKN